MEITDIRIFKTNKKGPVLAYANIILNNCFIVRGITLVETEKRKIYFNAGEKIKRRKEII